MEEILNKMKSKLRANSKLVLAILAAVAAFSLFITSVINNEATPVPETEQTVSPDTSAVVVTDSGTEANAFDDAGLCLPDSAPSSH